MRSLLRLNHTRLKTLTHAKARTREVFDRWNWDAERNNAGGTGHYNFPCLWTHAEGVARVDFT